MTYQQFEQAVARRVRQAAQGERIPDGFDVLGAYQDGMPVEQVARAALQEIGQIRSTHLRIKCMIDEGPEPWEVISYQEFMRQNCI